MIPKPTPDDLSRNAEREHAGNLAEVAHESNPLLVKMLHHDTATWIRRAVAAERERDEARARVAELEAAHA